MEGANKKYAPVALSGEATPMLWTTTMSTFRRTERSDYRKEGGAYMNAQERRGAVDEERSDYRKGEERQESKGITQDRD